MARPRWLVPWKDSLVKPVFYHCVSRVVDRQLVFGPLEKEKFRTLLRMQENFTGCRALAYCVMGNHFHLLLEAVVAEVAQELAEARRQVREGLAEEGVVAARIHGRHTYRMHDLSEFMKTLVQRFTQWFNRTHQRQNSVFDLKIATIASKFNSPKLQGGGQNRSEA